MTTLKEISTKCEYSENNEYVCGPQTISTVTAEMLVEDNNEHLYLMAHWMQDFEDEMVFIANNKSLYDYYTLKQDCDDKYDEILQNNRETIESVSEIESSQFCEQYKKLGKMVVEKMKEEGIETTIKI